MDFKLNREILTCSVPITDTEVTQAAEHDFILPDYCPDIFRVLKCCFIPSVTSTGINGNRLTFDLSVIIRVIYRSSGGAGVYCVEHTHDFSKTVDLPADSLNPSVSVIPNVEYVNCRVVNQRRLDVRGSIVCKVKVTGEKQCEVVSNAFGCGIQLKKSPVVYPAKRLTAAKRITVIEEMELAAGKPPFGSIVRCDATVRKGEQKIISGKLITRGEIDINILYNPKDNADKAPEPMKFSIPFSQIIDIEGIDETYETTVDINAPKCVIVPKNDEDGTLECELVMLVSITAIRYDTCELVTDAYSTVYECECEKSDSAVISASEKLNMQFSAESEISCSDGEISQVYDLWCENASVSSRYDDIRGCIMLYGKLTFCMLGKLSDETSVYSEKEYAFEQELDCGDDDPKLITVNPQISVYGCSYNIGSGKITVKAEPVISGTKEKKTSAALLKSISVYTDKPKECDKNCAVKICYTDSGENLWEIAKKYSTSAEAILEENDIDNGDSGGRKIMIIPMKN